VTTANLFPLSQEPVSGLYLSQMTTVAFSCPALYDTVYSHLFIEPCIFQMFSIFHDFRPKFCIQLPSHLSVLSNSRAPISSTFVSSLYSYSLPFPVAARSKVCVCGRSLAGIVGSNPAGAWVSSSSGSFVLSYRSLCVGLITRAEKSYRV